MRVGKWKPPFGSKWHMPTRWKHTSTNTITYTHTHACTNGTRLLNKISISSDTLLRVGWFKLCSEYSKYNETLGNNKPSQFQKKKRLVIIWGKNIFHFHMEKWINIPCHSGWYYFTIPLLYLFGFYNYHLLCNLVEIITSISASWLTLKQQDISLHQSQLSTLPFYLPPLTPVMVYT